ncbi:cytochrome c oxidase assembly protein, partial [Lutimaribacter sp. EGI FJ00014]|nr:cytochrome c oxidase assembly protein [Lutimaribacter sp. EGI FJ00014]
MAFARICFWALLCAAVPQDIAAAHAIDPVRETASWGWTAFTVASLALSAWLYARGLHRLWARAKAGAGIRRWQAAAFAGGWMAAAAALLSPLDHWAEELFSAHMVQHEILMLVAAPLVVLGRPASAFLWAFPPGGRRRIGRFLASPWWLATRRPFAHSLGAWA